MTDSSKKLSLDNYLLGKGSSDPKPEVEKVGNQLPTDIPKSNEQQAPEIMKYIPQDQENTQSYKTMTEEQKLAEFEKQEKELIQERDEEIARMQQRAKGQQFEADNDYLALYEKQYQQEKLMQEVFYQEQSQEQQEVESKRPALFRKTKPGQSKPNFHQEMKDMSPTSENLKNHLVSKEGNQVEFINQNAFRAMFIALKERQIRFYAFLNKEFNILNYKAARCSYYCFDDLSSTVAEASKWVHLCREGLLESKSYAEQLQNQADQEIKECQQKSESLDIKTDPTMHWIAWYEKLILKFDDMEKELASEFSNII